MTSIGVVNEANSPASTRNTNAMPATIQIVIGSWSCVVQRRRQSLPKCTPGVAKVMALTASRTSFAARAVPPSSTTPSNDADRTLVYSHDFDRCPTFVHVDELTQRNAIHRHRRVVREFHGQAGVAPWMGVRRSVSRSSLASNPTQAALRPLMTACVVSPRAR